MSRQNLFVYIKNTFNLFYKSVRFSFQRNTAALISLFIVIFSLNGCSGGAGFDQAQKIVPDNAADEDRFGLSLDIAGNQAIISAPGADSPYENSGAAYFYEYIADSGWTFSAMLSPAGPDMSFGADVSLSGNRALIGVPLSSLMNNRTPSARIYEQSSDGTWIETAEILPPEDTFSSNFATSVALQGNVAFIASPLQWVPDTDGNPGVVYVFERQNDGEWQLITRLMASDPDHDDRFGSDIDLSGDRAIIGARNDDEMGEDAGAAYIFERQQDGSWLEVAKLAPAGSDGRFGTAVSLDGELAIIGAPWYLYEGTAHIFALTESGDWEEFQVLEAIFEERSSLFEGNILFGSAVHIDSNRALVGAPSAANSDEIRSGRAYLFEFQEDSTWAGTIIEASDESEIGQFGDALVLSDNHILVGAFDTENQPGVTTGAVYHFRK